MRLMGLDVGDRTIGVALSDSLKLTAQALKTVKRKSKKKDAYALRLIAEAHDVEKIVVGLPRNMNGSLGPQGEKVKVFADWLGEQLDLEIVYEDERLTTAMAERTLIEADVSRRKRKAVIDALAAVHILQSYLDKTR